MIDLEALQAAASARRERIRAKNIAAGASGSAASRNEDVETIDIIAMEEAAAADLLYEQRQGIRQFLSLRAAQFNITEIWHNPESQPGARLYQRFFASWTAAPLKRLRMVFHGTAEANIHAICRDGLDPGRRGSAVGQAYGPGEYFGGDASVSHGYCGGGRKMIIFVVLLDPSGVTTENEQMVRPPACLERYPIIAPSSALPPNCLVATHPRERASAFFTSTFLSTLAPLPFLRSVGPRSPS